MSRRIAVWMAAAALAGCMPAVQPGTMYRIALTDVDRSSLPVRPEESRITEVSQGLYQFEDPLLRVRARVGWNAVGLELRNVQPVEAVVDWNDAEFVDVLGRPHPVAYHGTHADPDAPAGHTACRVPPGGELRGVVTPVGAEVVPREYDAAGRRMALRVPVEAEGRRQVYTFWFQIGDREPHN